MKWNVKNTRIHAFTRVKLVMKFTVQYTLVQRPLANLLEWERLQVEHREIDALLESKTYKYDQMQWEPPQINPKPSKMGRV